MSAAETKRPVQLQVNNSGAWKTVMRFDAGDEGLGGAAQRAAQQLWEADQRTSWRIATDERHPVVLRAMSAGTYGVWMTAEAA
jgi:hypothetical protein